MKKSFLQTLNGKFVSRTVLLAVAIAVVIGGLAIASLRSLNGTANASVDYARDRLPQDAVEPIEALASDISAASSRLTLLLLLITVIGAIAAGALALVFARQITSPIVRLRDAAMKSATALPEIVEASANGDEELPELPSIVLTSGDEVEELAHSFNVVQRTAAELAVKQARMRQHNSERFVNLGRRSQNLLARQMNFIDAMEKDEANPANLKRLFQIDHLATRMRRNAESVLVLAEEGSPRRLRGPVSMHQVVQAASGEIEHFERIAISSIADASVEPSVAHDLAHLLAELLENATSFAPPEKATSVSGATADTGYLIEIVDHGIGMEAEAMAAANARFADTTNALNDDHSPSYLGHEVVARLSRRHGVEVELVPTPTGGLTARLRLPAAALRSPGAQPANHGSDVSQGAPAPVATEPQFAADPAAMAAPAVADAPSFSDHVETPLDPHDAASLQAFTPLVPNDASGLAQPESPSAGPVPDAATLESFATQVPDDASSLMETDTPSMQDLPGPETFAASVPDDASSLVDLPNSFDPAIQAPLVDAPQVEAPSIEPVAEAPAFDAPSIEPVAEAPQFEEPAFDAPAFDAVVETPQFDAPQVEAPSIDPVAEAPQFDVPSFDVPSFDHPTTEAVVEAPTFETEAATAVDAVVEAPTFETEAATAVDAVMEAPTAVDAVMEAPTAVDAVMEAPAFEAEAATATAPEAAATTTEAAQELSEGQRAAIEWAMEQGGGSISSAAPAAGPVAATAAGAALVSDAAELRPGPIDAATLSALDTTPSGFVPRVRGEEGAKHFSPTAEAPRRATSAPNPEQLIKFREGIESGRGLSTEDGDTQ